MIIRFLICLLLTGFWSTPLFATAQLQAEATLPEPLRIAISNDSFPYMFADDAGQPAGLVVDYWQQLAAVQGISVEFVMVDWPETLRLLQDGAVHLHGGIARTAERAQQYQLGNTGIDIHSNVFLHRDLPEVSKLAALKPYAIGVIEQSSHINTLNQLLPGAILKTYPNVSAMYDAALAGEIKVMTGLDRLPPRYAKYQQLAAQFPLYRKVPLRNIALSYALNKNDPLDAVLAQASAAITASFLDQLERRWLGVVASEDTLLLGVPIDNQPYMHVSLQGEAQGLFVDLWRHWSELTGVKIAFVPDSSLNNLQQLAKGRIDALVAFPGNNNLPQGVAPAYQLYAFESQFYHLAKPAAQPLQADSEVKVGLFENAPYLDELKQRYPLVQWVRYAALSEMVSAVMSGELAGFYGASAIVPLRLQQMNLQDLLTAQTDSRIVSPLYSLTRADRPQLAEQIKQGFASMSLDTLIQIENKWISAASQRYFPQFLQQTPLTAQERQWLERTPSVKVGMLANWPPMEFVDDEGKPSGVTVDMFDILSERMQMQFEIVSFTEFDTMLAALKQKEIDLIANISDRPERHEYARFTDEFWSTQWAVISASDSSNIISTSQLSEQRVAIYKDYQLAQHLNEVFPAVKIVPVTDLRQGLELLQQKQVDYVLDSVEAASEMLRQAGYLYLRVQILDDLPSYPSLIAVRDDYAPLVVMLNKGLRSIGKEERQQLYKKWFSFQITQGINKAQLRRLMWQVGGVAAVLLVFVVFWNFSLRREVSLRRNAEQKMRFMATHDDLTRLPNRSLVKERIEQALLQHARHNEILALLFIDLDGFKEVNDSHGHDVGDELLLKLAGILQHSVRKSDTVARFGGDEFVILLTGLLSRDDAAIVAEKILHQLAQPVSLSVGDVQVGASIGIAVYPDDGTDSAKLLKVADSLMYRIKQQGKNQYCFSKAVFS